MRITCVDSLSRKMSFGTKDSPTEKLFFDNRVTSFLISNTVLSSSSGREYWFLLADFANDNRQSSLAINCALCWMGWMYCAISSTRAENNFTSSSCIFSSAPNILASRVLKLLCYKTLAVGNRLLACPFRRYLWFPLGSRFDIIAKHIVKCYFQTPEYLFARFPFAEFQAANPYCFAQHFAGLPDLGDWHRPWHCLSNVDRRIFGYVISIPDAQAVAGI